MSDRTPEQVMAEALDPESGEDARHMASEQIVALNEAGFAVVPVEPTDKMVEAMKDAEINCYDPIANCAPAIWRAAVAANEEGE